MLLFPHSPADEPRAVSSLLLSDKGESSRVLRQNLWRKQQTVQNTQQIADNEGNIQANPGDRLSDSTYPRKNEMPPTFPILPRQHVTFPVKLGLDDLLTETVREEEEEPTT